MAENLRRCAAIAASLLLAGAVLLTAPWHAPLGAAALFEQKPTALSVAVFVLLIMTAFTGTLRRNAIYRSALFVAALVGAIGDARFALLFAAVAAWNLTERAPA